jgi:hypothetical protein
MKRENAKMKANDLIRLSVFYLNKNGFFKGIVSGDIPVIRYRLNIAFIDSLFAEGAVIPEGPIFPYIVTESSYHILVSTLNKNAPYMHFSYASPQPNGEYKNFGYYVDLIATPCRYGGVRYWFRCPLTVNGKYCGRKVAVLYRGNDFFGCSNCFNLTYESRNSRNPSQKWRRSLKNRKLIEEGQNRQFHSEATEIIKGG